jgi:hypothetical protein
MEQLPYIDEHATTVRADAEMTWAALLRVFRGATGAEPSPFSRALGVEPALADGEWSPALEPGAALPGFRVSEARRAELLSLRGGHRFASYRLDLALEPDGPDATRVTARTWAAFPGAKGKVYRALVIGSRGHKLVVWALLRRMRAAAS